MRKTQLKIKIKSLAEESKIIRLEENKLTKQIKHNKEKSKDLNSLRESLSEHRKSIVRNEARYSLLAYALLRNIPYHKVETKCKNKPDLGEVISIAKRFGANSDMIGEWTKQATEYLKGK